MKDKIKIVLIDAKFFCDFLADGRLHKFKIIKGLPLDAEVINAKMNWRQNKIELLISSETFEQVKPDAEIPIFGDIVAQAYNTI